MVHKSAPTSLDSRALLEASLQRRLAQPQRHRLLHGYPMVLGRAHRAWQPLFPSDRPLLVGVLPHPFCNPVVRGCGFCTFPHETLQRSRMAALGRAVATEIRRRGAEVTHRPVPAVYLGGGTANLMSAADFAPIGRALEETFDLSGAELTLEGAPRYFGLRGGELLQACAALGPRRLRISMGVQTFDRTWLARMGRLGFGAPEHVADAVERARKLGVGTSCDLLVNLPGQPLAAMVADIEHAVDLGFDQICIYPLVLRADLDAAWANDPQLLGALPSPAMGFASWRIVRRALLARGYMQRTLTNFERDLPATERFAYEPWSFRPTTCDAVGFGPGALSTTGLGSGTAYKWQNASGAGPYLAAMAAAGPVHGHVRYDGVEGALTVLTRQLVQLRAPQPRGSWASPALSVLEAAGLLQVSHGWVRLTERGMFYADSVAGLLAEPFVHDRRRDDAVRHRMG